MPMELPSLRKLQTGFIADLARSPEARDSKRGCEVYFTLANREGRARVIFEKPEEFRINHTDHPEWAKSAELKDHWIFTDNLSARPRKRRSSELMEYLEPQVYGRYHYVLCFNHVYIETTAMGVWVEKIEQSLENLDSIPRPFDPLPLEKATQMSVFGGVECRLAISDVPADQLAVRAKLCSQALFDFYSLYNGKWKNILGVQARGDDEAVVSFIRGRKSRTVRGIARPEEYAIEFFQKVKDIRQKHLGVEKSQHDEDGIV